jgi:hypothetical protein
MIALAISREHSFQICCSASVFTRNLPALTYELKDQMYRHRDCIDTVDQVAFGWAQSEVEAAVLFRKAWQAVKIIDFLGSQDRQTAEVSGQVR